MLAGLHVLHRVVDGPLRHVEPAIFRGSQRHHLQHGHRNVRVAGHWPVAPAALAVLRRDDEPDDLFQLGPDRRRARLAVEFGQGNRRDAMAIHVLAAVAIGEQPLRGDLVEQVMHPGRDVLAKLAFAGQLACRLQRHQRVARDGHAVALLVTGRTPGPVGQLFRRQPFQRPFDDRFGLLIDGHFVPPSLNSSSACATLSARASRNR